MQNVNERRINKRQAVHSLVCRCGSIPGNSGLCVVQDVSLEGAFVLNQTPPPIGANVDLQFSRAPLEGYYLQGTVVRTQQDRPRGFAVHFDTPRPRMLRVVYHSNP